MEPKNELKDTKEIVRSLSTRGNRTFRLYSQMTMIWKHRSLLVVTELVVSCYTTLEIARAKTSDRLQRTVTFASFFTFQAAPSVRLGRSSIFMLKTLLTVKPCSHFFL